MGSWILHKVKIPSGARHSHSIVAILQNKFWKLCRSLLPICRKCTVVQNCRPYAISIRVRGSCRLHAATEGACRKTPGDTAEDCFTLCLNLTSTYVRSILFIYVEL